VFARICSLLSLASVCACGGAQYPSLDEPMPAPTSPPSAAGATAPSTTPNRAVNSLARGDVEQVVDGGLGRFLSHVSIEPKLANGKFVGWNIVSLSPPDLWQGVDLKPGDVVTRVNGMAIEREMEAYDAFQAVRQAAVLEVSFIRDNQARTLRLPIVGKPSAVLPKAPPAPSASTAPAGPG
jgi:S1-C subfamily serine protease